MWEDRSASQLTMLTHCYVYSASFLYPSHCSAHVTICSKTETVEVPCMSHREPKSHEILFVCLQNDVKLCCDVTKLVVFVVLVDDGAQLKSLKRMMRLQEHVPVTALA